MEKTLYVLILIFFISGCDQLKVHSQINDKEIEIRELKSKNEVLINEVKELSNQVARLNTNHPDGAVVEELRKALSQKETELHLREERYMREVESLQLMKKNLAKMQLEFYSEAGIKLEEIGEARQLKKEYSHMREALNDANESVSNWLVFITLIGIGFVASIMSLLYTGLKYSRQRRDINTAIKFVEDGRMSNQEKRLLTGYFGRQLESDSDRASLK